MPTILVIGATGTVGRPLVSELLATDVKVRALLAMLSRSARHIEATS
jgi:uncharacterized protein YbjT (DUF2867 family)